MKPIVAKGLGKRDRLSYNSLATMDSMDASATGPCTADSDSYIAVMVYLAYASDPDIDDQESPNPSRLQT
jgi:hypothetical protein